MYFVLCRSLGAGDPKFSVACHVSVEAQGTDAPLKEARRDEIPARRIIVLLP